MRSAQRVALYGSAAASLTVAGLIACNVIGFEAVSIQPTYGWVDGCTPVLVSGHGFEDDVTVTIGGQDLLDPVLPEDELDVGYRVWGLTPPAVNPEGGLVDIVVTTAGETTTLEGAFYYEVCYDTVYPEWADPTEGVASGTTITLGGCNLSTDYTVRVGSSTDDRALTSICSTAEATFDAPDMPDGSYYIGFFDSNGDQVWPLPDVCDIAWVPGSWTPDTGDTADDADPCEGVPVLTYGGAR